MDTIHFKKGEDIIEEGAPGDCAYIVEQGAVEVSKLTPHGEKQVLGVLGKSEIFGAMLGAWWILKGSQNHLFASCWQKKKTRKRRSGSGSGKNMKIRQIFDA